MADQIGIRVFLTRKICLLALRKEILAAMLHRPSTLGYAAEKLYKKERKNASTFDMSGEQKKQETQDIKGKEKKKK